MHLLAESIEEPRDLAFSAMQPEFLLGLPRAYGECGQVVLDGQFDWSREIVLINGVTVTVKVADRLRQLADCCTTCIGANSTSSKLRDGPRR